MIVSIEDEFGNFDNFDNFDGTVESAVDAAVAALDAGDAIVIPTDTIYGVAARAHDQSAVSKLFSLKERPATVPIPVLVADIEDLPGLVQPPTAQCQALIDQHWPGALTVVLARQPGFATDLGGDGTTIGVRCPDHPFVRAVARRVGPLATTSANRHGEPTPVDAETAAKMLGDGVTIAFAGGLLDGLASTVVDGTTDPIRVLRQGDLKLG